MTLLRVGAAVRLLVPDNPRLHLAPARIVSLESWGAHVETSVAATGKFRALWSEMEWSEMEWSEMEAAPQAAPVVKGEVDG